MNWPVLFSLEMQSFKQTGKRRKINFLSSELLLLCTFGFLNEFHNIFISELS